MAEDRRAANDRLRARYAREAPAYDRGVDVVERRILGTEHRAWACSRASGRTLELAIGTGLNLAVFPAEVHLTGVDLTREMLEGARRRARVIGRAVALCEGDAQALPFPDACFDTVLATYAMCSVPDLPATIAEVRRVLRPAGALILVDHVRSSVAPLRWLQHLVELMPSRTTDELTRRPIEQVVAGGFTIEESDRLRAGVVERLVARAPSAGVDIARSIGPE